MWLKIQSDPRSDVRRPAEMIRSYFQSEVCNNVSVIPRRLIGGLHEGHNERPTVPTRDLVNSLLGEDAEDF